MAETQAGRLLRNLALAAASVLGTLALLELLVRVFLGPVPPRNLTRVPESIRAPSPSPEIPYLLAPNAEAVHHFGSNPRGYFDDGANGDGTLTYRTNSLGLRDHEVARAKQPGAFRILGIGDSFTFGTGVRLEHLFLTRLEELLDAGNEPNRFEVLNLGVMGFNTAQEYALLREVGLGFDPDLVLIVFVLNDAHVLALPAQRGPDPEATNRGGTGSLLIDHVRMRLAARRIRDLAITATRAEFEPEAPGWRLAQHSLARARKLAREQGFRLAVVIFPILWQLDDSYPYAAVHATIARSVKRIGLPVFDLFEAFRGEDGESLWVHPSNQHPNEHAHAIAAEALHDWLTQSELLTPP